VKPLVSILIPAYNAEKWIAETIQSAIAQTWQHKEIIILDDGSRDLTAEVARGFASKNVKVVSTDNRGLSAAVNSAYRLCQGDYIQELDADDILAPDKIERQLCALRKGDGPRTLLSCPWGYFYYRTSRAEFRRTSLWNDLEPVEWLLRKLGENLHMQNATWLVSRELTEAVGPWDENLSCRVLLAAEKTRFVPGARIFYRLGGSGRVSYIGASDQKRADLLRSMKLHMQYLRSIEESERVRKACLTYLQNWTGEFYPERPDMFEELDKLAAKLGGRLEHPCLNWKYAWMAPVFGMKGARFVQRMVAEKKASLIRSWDKAMLEFESRAISR
jgi:glycosyltransferase involved in cell wall biosynthesis